MTCLERRGSSAAQWHFTLYHPENCQWLVYFGVARRDMLVRPAVLVIWMGAVCADHVDVSRDDEAEDLLPGPQSAWLEDGWLRHFAVPSGEEHQKVHHFPLQGGNAALGPFWV